MPDVNLNIEYLPHQLEFLNSQAPICALIGGFGSGKTRAAGYEEIINSINDPKTTHVILSPDLKQAKISVIPTMFEIIDTCFDPPLEYGVDWSFNKSNNVFNFRAWGGAVHIMGAHDPESLKGANWATCTLDEPGIMDKSTILQVQARVRDPRAKVRKIRLVGTPEDYNWLADFCEGEKKPKDLHLIRAKTRDNSYLPPEYIQGMLESYDPQMIAAYLEGQFVNLTTATAYASFSDLNIEDEFEIEPNLPILIGQDFNYDPNTAIFAQEVDGVVHVFDELFLKNCDTDAKCEQMQLRYPDHVHALYADAAANNRSGHGHGKSDIIMIRNAYAGFEHEMHIPKANPRRIDRLNSVNAMLKNAVGDTRLMVHRNCRELIKDLRRIRRDEFLNGNISDKDRGHISDALGYLIHRRYPIRRQQTHNQFSSLSL
jgi:hypothetical protein